MSAINKVTSEIKFQNPEQVEFQVSMEKLVDTLLEMSERMKTPSLNKRKLS